jgi:hypothetical protein
LVATHTIKNKAALERLREAGLPADQLPQHWPWNWAENVPKLGLDASVRVGIACAKAIQGLMLLATAGHSARLAPDSGQPLVYVDFLEYAPWQGRSLAEEPRYGAVGARLMEAAARASIAVGCQGGWGFPRCHRPKSSIRRAAV